MWKVSLLLPFFFPSLHPSLPPFFPSFLELGVGTLYEIKWLEIGPQSPLNWAGRALYDARKAFRQSKPGAEPGRTLLQMDIIGSTKESWIAQALRMSIE